MALAYLPAEKFLARKQESVIADEDVIYWKRLKQLAVFQEPSTVSSVAISPLRPYNIATTSSVRLTLYDNVVCEPLNMFSRFKKAVCSVDFRHDGNLLAIGGDEGKVRIFDVEKNTGIGKAAIRVMQASPSAVRSVHFSSRGDTVFAMSEDGSLKQFNVADTAYGANAVPTFEVKAHDDSIRCGAVSRTNDNIVVTGGYDHKVRLWDVRGGDKGIEIDCEYPVESVLFLPGEQLLATAAGPIVNIWDLATNGRKLVSLQAHYKTVTSLRLATNSTCLLTAGIDRRLNIFRTSNYSLIHSMSFPSPILGVDVSKDDATVAIAMGNLLGVYRRADVKKEITATSTALADKRSVVRTAAPKVRMTEKGEAQKTVDVVAKSNDKLKLARIDNMLKGFQHAAVVRRLFTSNHSMSLDIQLVGYLRVIVLRGAIRRAIAGQEVLVQKNILKFLCAHLFREQFFDILRRVADAFFEVYEKEALDPEVVKLCGKLRSAIARELDVQNMLASAVGALEMIIATTKTNVNTADDICESDDIFGEPTVSAKDLEVVEGEQKPEVEEEEK